MAKHTEQKSIETFHQQLEKWVLTAQFYIKQIVKILTYSGQKSPPKERSFPQKITKLHIWMNPIRNRISTKVIRLLGNQVKIADLVRNRNQTYYFMFLDFDVDLGLEFDV